MRTEATTERVLRLLAMLQRRSTWTAAELAAELDVTDRSVRRDIERLRAVGYPVQAVPGVGGGYRLGAGKNLPPLLFDDDEATAAAVSLGLAAGGTVAGVGEAGLSALAKLDQVMPPRLRGAVRAVTAATDTLAGPGVQVNPEVLAALARACRDQVRVRFQYARPSAQEQQRAVEPLRLVTTRWRWYLMAYDLDRQDFRTFRLDRIHQVVASTWRFALREHPDPVDYVQRSVTAAPYQHVAQVRLRARAAEVARRVPPQVAKVEDDDGGWCLLTAGADHLEWLAMHIALLDLETQILSPPELRAAASRLGQRLKQFSSTTDLPAQDL